MKEENKDNRKKKMQAYAATIELPESCGKFVKDNPRVAERIARGLSEIAQCNLKVKKIRDAFSKPELFIDLLDKGTEDQLIEFLIEIQSVDDPKLVPISDEQREQIVDDMENGDMKIGGIQSNDPGNSFNFNSSEFDDPEDFKSKIKQVAGFLKEKLEQMKKEVDEKRNKNKNNGDKDKEKLN